MFEILKSYDPDCKICLKVYPDSVNNLFVNQILFQKEVQDDHTLKESDSVFVLRYGSVSITFGLRRKLSMESYQKILVHTLEAYNLSSMHRGTFGNIISNLPNNQTLLDFFLLVPTMNLPNF